MGRRWLNGANEQRAQRMEDIESDKKDGVPSPVIQVIQEETPQAVWQAFCKVLRDSLPRLTEQRKYTQIADVIEGFLDKAQGC